MPDITISIPPISEIELVLSNQPDPVWFAETYFPAIENMIEFANTPQDAAAVRNLANLARIYVKDSIKQVVKDRHEAFRITEKGAWAHVLAVRQHGKLWKQAKDEGETRPVGNPQLLGQDKKNGRFSNWGNSPDCIGWEDAGFRDRKDATVSERIGELNEQDLGIYREESRQYEKCVSINGAHWVWKVLHPEEKSVPMNPEDYLLLKTRGDATKALLKGDKVASLVALLGWIESWWGDRDILIKLLRQALTDTWQCDNEECGKRIYWTPPDICEECNKGKMKRVQEPWKDGEEPIKDIA
jgi:hypothetical protein